jgi:CheY-like chemotaxis protein
MTDRDDGGRAAPLTARVLIVDDDEMDGVLCRAALESVAEEVHFASNGEEALRIFEANEIDIVVTDMAMPTLSGLRLIQELQKRAPSVHVIAISGVNAEILDLAEDVGAVQSLVKPLSPPDLLAAVSEVLERRR